MDPHRTEQRKLQCPFFHHDNKFHFGGVSLWIQTCQCQGSFLADGEVNRTTEIARPCRGYQNAFAVVGQDFSPRARRVDVDVVDTDAGGTKLFRQD